VNADHAPARIDLAGGIEQVAYARVSDIGRAEDRLRLVRLVGAPSVFDSHQRQQHAFGVAQRNAGARLS